MGCRLRYGAVIPSWVPIFPGFPTFLLAGPRPLHSVHIYTPRPLGAVWTLASPKVPAAPMNNKLPRVGFLTLVLATLVPHMRDAHRLLSGRNRWRKEWTCEAPSTQKVQGRACSRCHWWIRQKQIQLASVAGMAPRIYLCTRADPLASLNGAWEMSLKSATTQIINKNPFGNDSLDLFILFSNGAGGNLAH